MRKRGYSLGLLSGAIGTLTLLAVMRLSSRSGVKPVEPPTAVVALPVSLPPAEATPIQIHDDTESFTQQFRLIEFNNLCQEILARVQIRERIGLLNVTIQSAVLAVGAGTQQVAALARPDAFFRPTDVLLLSPVAAVFLNLMLIRQVYRIALIKKYLRTTYNEWVRPHFRASQQGQPPDWGFSRFDWMPGNSVFGEWWLRLTEICLPLVFGMLGIGVLFSLTEPEVYPPLLGCLRCIRFRNDLLRGCGSVCLLDSSG